MLVVALALFVAQAFAQSGTPVVTPIVTDIYNQTNKELGQAAGLSAGEAFTKRFHVHFVVLVNSTQVRTKPNYAEVALSTIQSLAQRLLEDQNSAGVGEDAGHMFSLYPYQLDLYDHEQADTTSKAWTIARGLPLNKKGIQLLVEAFPKDQIKVRPNGSPYRGQGHNNDEALKKLLENLGADPNPGAAVVVYQFTDLILTDDPERQGLEKPMGTHLPGGFEQMPMLPQYAVDSGSSSSPAKLVVRGFRVASVPKVALIPTGTGNGPQKVTEPSGDDNAGLVALAILLGGLIVGGAIFWFSGKVHVQLGVGESFVLRRGKRIDIYGPGAKASGKNVYVLGPTEGAAAEPLKLASIRFGLEPSVEAEKYQIVAGARTYRRTRLRRSGTESRLVLQRQEHRASIRIKVK